MHDNNGYTVEDYKAEIKRHKEDMTLYNKWLNRCLKDIFAPKSKYHTIDVYTKKGTLRAQFVKRINLYTTWIENRKRWIALSTKWMKELEAKIKEAK